MIGALNSSSNLLQLPVQLKAAKIREMQNKAMGGKRGHAGSALHHEKPLWLINTNKHTTELHNANAN